MRKVLYLETSSLGLAWMRSYYRKNPQLRMKEAVVSLQHAESLISDPIFLAPQYEGDARIRKMRIENTQFSLLYVIDKEVIYVVDIHDPRGLRSHEAILNFSRELRQRYNVII